MAVTQVKFSLCLTDMFTLFIKLWLKFFEWRSKFKKRFGDREDHMGMRK